MTRTSLIATVAVAGLWAAASSAADWPQWRGPARDGRTTQPARTAWPAAVAARWKQTVGTGHASPVVVGGRVFVFAREGDDEVLHALDLATGRRLWRQAYAAPYVMNSAARAHGKGPKSTPAVAGGRVCTLGISGILSCHDADGGRLLWRQEFARQHRETSPLYGTAMSPLIDAGRVIAHVGGSAGGALTAFDVATGTVRWAWQGDGPAYSSPVIAELAGVRQVVTFSESNLVGLDAATGALLWSVPFTTPFVQNAVTPVVHGGRVIYTGLDHPLKALHVVKKDGRFTTRTAWENDEVGGYMSSPVLLDGRVYGLSQRRKGQLFALDAETGKTLWLSEGRQGDHASLLAGGGALFVLTTDAELTVLPARADAAQAPASRPLARYDVADTPTWAHPVVLDDGFLVKDEDSLAYIEFTAAPAAGRKEQAMSWIFFMVGAVLSWGLYGPVLHGGQSALGHPLRALLCVGAAYFLIGVLVPLIALGVQGQLRGFTAQGVGAATAAGALGAVGAVCIIWAFRSGGSPLYVMPLVFAGAPVVNVLFSLWRHPPQSAPSPMLYVGFVLAALGGYLVLHYKPQG